MTETTFDVLGIGNAIVDVIAPVSNAFLVEEGLTKGRMELIDTARAEQLYRRMAGGIEASGGSAANTMAGIASLGGKAVYIGKVGDDALGKFYAGDMAKIGVEFTTSPARAYEMPTGRSLILVTPDGERTMNTYLGAASLLTSDDIDPNLVKAAKVTYLEGYRFDLPENKSAFFRAARLAHGAGRKVALTLSDGFCVEAHRQHLHDLIEGHIDILFANESEIQALYQSGFDEACNAISSKVEVACLTRGARGSEIVAGGNIIHIKAEPIDRVIDTTGAGDLYAAGFLYGYTRGLTSQQSGCIAAIAACEVIGHYGPRPEISLAELIRNL